MWRSTWPPSRRVATRSRRRSRACGAASSSRSAIRPSCARAATPSTRSGPRWGRRHWPRPEEGGVIPKQGQFARDSFGIFAAQIAVMAMGIGTSVITARTLGPSGRGLFQLLTIFPATMSKFAKLGVRVATVYCIRRRGARTSAGRRTRSSSPWGSAPRSRSPAGSGAAGSSTRGRRACWPFRQAAASGARAGAPRTPPPARLICGHGTSPIQSGSPRRMAFSKLFIVGLDSATPALVFDRWRDQLPTLSSLIARGAHGRMLSTHPPITVPAWTSMTASRDPGELGVYGFRNRKDHSYDGYAFANSAQVKVPRLWDWLGQARLHTVGLGVPETYAPSAVNGERVRCFLTPSTRSEYTYPPALKATA